MESRKKRGIILQIQLLQSKQQILLIQTEREMFKSKKPVPTTKTISIQICTWLVTGNQMHLKSNKDRKFFVLTKPKLEISKMARKQTNPKSLCLKKTKPILGVFPQRLEE